MAEPLFLLADSAIVGRLGTVPLGGLGVAGQALTTLVGISIFLAYGTTAAVARQLGAGNHRAAIRQGIDGLWLARLTRYRITVFLGIDYPARACRINACRRRCAIASRALSRQPLTRIRRLRERRTGLEHRSGQADR